MHMLRWAILMQAAERALEVVSLLPQAGCTCCAEHRRALAYDSYVLLVDAICATGNIMEACRILWIVERLQTKASSSLFGDLVQSKVFG